MEKKYRDGLAALIAALSLALAGCASDAGQPGAATGKSLRLKYAFGAHSGANNIYVIWAENPEKGYYQPFYVCKRLLDGSVTGADVLPFWHLNAYPKMTRSEVDAVTSATKAKQDFTLDLTLAADAPDSFTLYFETDASFNPNDWFADQPAILYKAEIHFDALASRYSLEFCGWTPHSTILGDSRVATGNASLSAGTFQAEKRYITNHSDATASGGFGAADERAETSLVGTIVVTSQ
jgi:hypothetical protein